MSRYAEIADLQALGIATAALAEIADADLNKALESASGEADSYLASQYTLPITAAGAALKQHVCGIAAYRAMAARGFNAMAETNELIRTGYDDAIAWLKLVASGALKPELTDSRPQAADAPRHVPRFVTGTSRGWDRE